MHFINIYRCSDSIDHTSAIASCMGQLSRSLQKKNHTTQSVEAQRLQNNPDKIIKEVDNLLKNYNDQERPVFILHMPIPGCIDEGLVSSLKKRGRIMTVLHEFADREREAHVDNTQLDKLHNIAVLSDRVIVATAREREALLNYTSTKASTQGVASLRCLKEKLSNKITVCPIPATIDVVEAEKVTPKRHIPTFFSHMGSSRGVMEMLNLAEVISDKGMLNGEKVRIIGSANDQIEAYFSDYKEVVARVYGLQEEELVALSEATNHDEVNAIVANKKPALPIELYPNLDSKKVSQLLSETDIFVSFMPRGLNHQSSSLKVALAHEAVPFIRFSDDITDDLREVAIEVDSAEDAAEKIATYVSETSPEHKSQMQRKGAEIAKKYNADHFASTIEAALRSRGDKLSSRSI